MFEIHKSYILDNNQQPIAIQIPIAEFEQIEEVLENYGLIQLMNAEAGEESEPLSKADALEYYQSLKSKMWKVEYTRRFLKDLWPSCRWKIH